MGLFDVFGDEYALTIFVFVFVTTFVYATGGTYSESVFVGWLGLLGVIPFAIGAAAGASLGAIFLPFIALALFVYCGLLQKAIGPVAILVWIGFIALTLGV